MSNPGVKPLRPVWLPPARNSPEDVPFDERQQRRASFWMGAALGAILALSFAMGIGIGAARWQEASFSRQLRLVQAQHEEQLRLERSRIARYDEIDRLARQYDAMQGR